MSTTYNPATLEFIKKDATRRRKQRAVASLVGLLLVASLGAGGWYLHNRQAATAKAEVAKSVVADVKNPRDAWQKLRAAVDAGQMTEDQAREAGRAAMEKERQRVMDGYFATPTQGRDKYLDQLIDEQQKRMAEWQKNRPTTRPWDGNRGPTTQPGNGNGRNGGGNDQAAREARGRARADNTSPVQRAQNSEFRAAMEARMRARGIQPGRGFGGGRFGGGGRGPGGGGR